MSESQDSCAAEIARLQAEVQRLEKELFDATQPQPGYEYKIVYVDPYGIFSMTRYRYSSLAAFDSEVGGFGIRAVCLIKESGVKAHE